MAEFESIDKIFAEHIPADQLKHVQRVLYGDMPSPLPVNAETASIASENKFEVASWKFKSHPEQSRAPRLVRVGLIQNSIVKETTAPVVEQYEAIRDKVGKIIDAAALEGVNVICLQEAWTCPFFFCTREKYPWVEFAEDPETGPSVQWCCEKAKQHGMVIVAPIFERDAVHSEELWNTAVVIGHNGNVIGKHRKNHIPRVGDFNESTYYLEGNTGHPVFETKFGKIAINICYGRHHPLNWMMFGLNGAEIVFNPSATVGALSEPMWAIEARNAAIANSYFVGGINRVGTEHFPNEFTSGNGAPAHKDFGHFYGSSYMAAPDCSRSPALSRTMDGLHISEIDLNLCRRLKDTWMLRATARYSLYAESLNNYVQPDYQPQVITDPGLARPSQ